MITIVWEYQVKTNHISEFQKIYASNGKWTELFKKGKGYIGTRLIRSPDHPNLFITIDQWQSVTDYNTFISQWKMEYKKLDQQCQGLTEHESCLGTFGADFNDEENTGDFWSIIDNLR
jgi:quinol monooxygenase YgiN